MLTAEQALAYSAVVAGHNILIMGQAGTGKTFLMKEIISCSKNAGTKIALLCTTGMGSFQFTGAQTVHR